MDRVALEADPISRGAALPARAGTAFTRRRLLTLAGGALVGTGALLLGAIGLSGDHSIQSLSAETLIFGSPDSDPGGVIASGNAAAAALLIAPAISGERAATVPTSDSGAEAPGTDLGSPAIVAVATSADSGSGAGAPAEVLAPETSRASAIRDFIASLPPAHRIRIPGIDLDIEVVTVKVDSENRVGTPSFAVGRFVGGGEVGLPGNVILSGHNDIDGAVFGKLPDLGDGDTILLHRGNYEFTYVADFAVKVWEEGAPPATRRENARFLLPTVNAITTLITCYPPWVDTHRWIVRASFLEMRDLSSGADPGLNSVR